MTGRFKLTESYTTANTSGGTEGLHSGRRDRGPPSCPHSPAHLQYTSIFFIHAEQICVGSKARPLSASEIPYTAFKQGTVRQRHGRHASIGAGWCSIQTEAQSRNASVEFHSCQRRSRAMHSSFSLSLTVVDALPHCPKGFINVCVDLGPRPDTAS